jgi:hypothetical protein
MSRLGSLRRRFKRLRWWCNAAGLSLVALALLWIFADFFERQNAPPDLLFLMKAHAVVATEIFVATLPIALWMIFWTGYRLRGFGHGLFYLAAALIFPPAMLFVVPLMIRLDYERFTGERIDI